LDRKPFIHLCCQGCAEIKRLFVYAYEDYYQNDDQLVLDKCFDMFLQNATPAVCAALPLDPIAIARVVVQHVIQNSRIKGDENLE